ncbi:MAG TPA: SOS response-associated peptidase [Steroidobacteraceae bacterium]|nr:SOS response-associated peptidase [Steroidobacteraceae bacterium]
MCGRYIIRQQGKALREWERYGPPPFLDSYNVAPSQQVPAVRRDGQTAGYALMRWGLIPFFAHGEPPRYATINARIETVESAPSYRDAWRRGRRCLQLASGFYEWHWDERGRKAPWLITLADQDLFAFAGLWERSVKSDGSIVESCAHITLPANTLMADIHNGGAHPQRMPAILRSEDHDAWLNGTLDEAKGVLKPYSAELMVAYEVSTQVNSVRNNFPALLQPIDQAVPEFRFG